MKLKYEFQAVEVAGETIAVPIIKDSGSFNGALKVNEVALDILNLLQNDTTEAAMIDTLLQEYDASREKIGESVYRVVNQLREAGLLVE